MLSRRSPTPDNLAADARGTRGELCAAGRVRDFGRHPHMNVVWLIPWHPVEDAGARSGLLAELRRELPRGHVLAGVRLTAIGARQDCDDVLFALDDGRVAVVHLTWSGRTEPVSDHPWTVLFDSMERFVQDEMKPEHRAWG